MSSFAQPAVPLDDIFEGMFNLLNFGNGYTDVGIKQMSTSEMFWHLKRLTKKTGDEVEARKRAQLQAQARKAAINSPATGPAFLRSG